MMEKIDDTEDYMLYALLNGGAPYLIRDGAYPDFDGSFEGNVKMHIMEDIKRCKVVTELHKKVAKCEMVSHEWWMAIRRSKERCFRMAQR